MAVAPGSILRCVISSWLDTTTPADAQQITPHFHVNGSAEDADTIATDLLTMWKGYIGASLQTTTQLQVAVYDAKHAPPNYPLATKTINGGLASVSIVNRDVAGCLSYYSTYNRPRYRGRLYLSFAMLGLTPSGAVIGASNITKILALAPLLCNFHSTNLDFGVWSRADQQFRTASDFWVDDAYDSQRRRGRRPGSRQTQSINGRSGDAGEVRTLSYFPAPPTEAA